VDHRSDVYSLGATLYELLTLKPIFDGRDRHELLRQIADAEPAPPRSVNRSIPEELETIVLKAVAKEPADRYATAGELADDLGRFLDDRPIRARRPTVFEKATKWARRHRAVVTSAVAALLLTVAGLAVATALTARAYDRECQKAAEAAEQRASAEENFRKARQAVDRLAQIGEDELAGNPDLEWLRWRLLEATLTYYQDFSDQRPDDPTTQAELENSRARARAIIGELTTLVGSYQYIPLHFEEVLMALELSADQREAIEGMKRNWFERTRQIMGRGPGERERRRLELARDQEVRVAQILSPGQRRRFKQIALQFVGPLAFSDPDVAADLRLTPDQKQQIRAIQDQAGSAVAKFHVHSNDPETNAARKRARDKILGVLTSDQKRKWQDMIGAPFRFEYRLPPPRHAPNRPPDRGPRPGKDRPEAAPGPTPVGAGQSESSRP
jgi:hypothetical protein